LNTTDHLSNQHINRDIWDLQFNHDVTAPTGDNQLGGAEFDGTYFYLPEWDVDSNIYKFDKNGNLIETFTIPGVYQLRDLAYDGTYFYGANGLTSGIWQMDFTNHVLLDTIPTPHTARSVAYDEYADGGNGGFWVNVWSSDIDLIDRSGNILDTIPSTTTIYGSAWDNVYTLEGYDGPFLWVFCTDPPRIEQYDIPTKILTGVSHNVENDLGAGGMAGGLFFTTEYLPGYSTLGGCYQGDPHDILFGYEITQIGQPPAIPSIPSGTDEGITDIEYSLETVTTDPDEDNVSYMFDWGDGTYSDWIGPVPSGTSGRGSHAWNETGTYEIKAKAKDTEGMESEWSNPHTITITGSPLLEIESLSGGLFKIKVNIINKGTDAIGINWTLSLEGGAFIGKVTTGENLDILSGESAEVSSGLILGLGATTVTFEATVPDGPSITKTQDGFILLFLINIKPSGGLL